MDLASCRGRESSSGSSEAADETKRSNRRRVRTPRDSAIVRSPTRP
jgi:hypothetical protein